MFLATFELLWPGEDIDMQTGQWWGLRRSEWYVWDLLPRPASFLYPLTVLLPTSTFHLFAISFRTVLS